MKTVKPGTKPESGHKVTVSSEGRVLGITPDNKLVVKFFDFIDTHGLPLDVVVEHIHDSGLMPSWDDFLTQAKSKGWNMKRAVLRLSVVVKNVYGEAFHKEWLERVERYV